VPAVALGAAALPDAPDEPNGPLAFVHARSSNAADADCLLIEVRSIISSRFAALAVTPKSPRAAPSSPGARAITACRRSVSERRDQRSEN
jgi:hypothetical protein